MGISIGIRRIPVLVLPAPSWAGQGVPQPLTAPPTQPSLIFSSLYTETWRHFKTNMQDSLNICWELEATRVAEQSEGLWIPSSVYTHSHRHTYTDTHIQMCRHIHRDTYTQTHTQKHRHTQTHTQTHRHTHVHTHRETLT